MPLKIRDDLTHSMQTPLGSVGQRLAQREPEQQSHFRHERVITQRCFIQSSILVRLGQQGFWKFPGGKSPPRLRRCVTGKDASHHEQSEEIGKVVIGTDRARLQPSSPGLSGAFKNTP